VRRILEEVDATPEGAEREELLHDARKAAKRARHAAESVSRIFGADAIAFAEAKEAVQEALGSTRTPSSLANGCASWPGTRPARRLPSSTDVCRPLRRQGSAVPGALRRSLEGRGAQAPAPLAALIGAAVHPAENGISDRATRCG
jgi:CHAD domain